MDGLWWQMMKKDCSNRYKSVGHKHFILCALGYRNQIIMFIGINKILHTEDGKEEWLHTIMSNVCLKWERVSRSKELKQFYFDGY